jgi:hypothetical protein
LGRAEIVVDHDDVVSDAIAAGLDFLQFALPDIGAGQGVRQFLRDRADDLDVDRFG